MIQIHAVDRPEVPALPMPERFKTELATLQPTIIGST
jgi:hypothetical protein